VTSIRRDTDLVQAIIDLRRAGELLAHPCECSERPDKPHMLGDHLFQSTKDMRPGIKASAAELRGGGVSETGDDGEDASDPRDPHLEFCAVVGRGQAIARDIIGFIERHRPDRKLTVVRLEGADDDWCEAHLAAGRCEPRWRNEPLCRWCTEYRLTYRLNPPADIIAMREQGKRITVGQITASNKAERKRLIAERRKQQAKPSKAS
jgi:hypothetical protein